MVTSGDVTTKIHLSEISSITFCTTQVYVSGYLLSELAKSKIPVSFCDEKSFPVASSLPLYGAYNCTESIEKQLEWTVPSKKRVWQKIIRHKIEKQAEVLKLFDFVEESKRLTEVAQSVRSGDPTNREAAAAALYFSTLFGPGFSREIDSWINASLNYGYSILLSKLSREIVSRGYLTQIGVCHRGRLNQWNFGCDLMEPFRPYIDRLVLTSGLDDFDRSMRRLLIGSLGESVPYKDGIYKMSSVIGLYVKDCLDCLERKMSVDDLQIYAV